MRPINKDAFFRTVVITLISSWFTLVCIWPSACNKPTHPLHQEVGSSVLKAEHVRLINHYREQINLYRNKHDSLTSQLELAKTALVVYQKQSARNKSSLKKRLANIPHDSSYKQALLDSLRQEANEYIVSVDLEDSIQQKIIADLETIKEVQDTALEVCGDQVIALSELVETSIGTQQNLEKEIQRVRKIQKRQSAINSVLTGTTVTLSAVLLVMIIR